MPISNEFQVCECCKFPVPKEMLRDIRHGNGDICQLCHVFVLCAGNWVGVQHLGETKIIRTIRKAHGNIMREAL